jgi:hypothetical protein
MVSEPIGLGTSLVRGLEEYYILFVLSCWGYMTGPIWTCQYCRADFNCVYKPYASLCHFKSVTVTEWLFAHSPAELRSSLTEIFQP